MKSRNHRRAVVAALLLFGFAALPGAFAQSAPLVAYTYTSFASYGAADVLAKAFKARTGSDVQFVATGDSRTMLAKLVTERQAGGPPTADAFIGVEVNDLSTARGLFDRLTPAEVPNLANVPKELQFDPESRLIPYEDGYITLVYDDTRVPPGSVPRTFTQLLDPRYRKSLVVEDPRTSSPGLSFLLWTIARYGESGYLDYWKKLAPNILTIPQSWDAAFDLFSKGEAPMMVSFSTDHAYDVIANQSTHIQVLTPDDQGYRTIFGMGVVSGTPRAKLAQALLDTLLSVDVQQQLPETEWMYPANSKAAAPADWSSYAVTPGRPVLLDPAVVGGKLAGWLGAWADNVLSR